MEEQTVAPEAASYILATGADGHAILVEASQLTAVLDGFRLTNEQEENVVETSPEEPPILPPDRQVRFKCAECEIEYPSKRQLLRHHSKAHADAKPHQCEECSASFNQESNLALHRATHNTEGEPTCPVCHKKFGRMASLKSHLMLHETDEVLVCADCGEEFSTQFKLDKHMQVHLAEQIMDQSFDCRLCSKKFHKLNFLKEHMKMHYKLKSSLASRQYKKDIDRSAFPHKCYFCGKSFQKPSQLLRHSRIHTGERPFKCGVCDRAFNQKGALLIHEGRHSGARPFPCDFCPAAFAQKGNLRNHIRRVHSLLKEGAAYKCDLCSCTFRKLGSLNSHVSRAHAPPAATPPDPLEQATQALRSLNEAANHPDTADHDTTGIASKKIDDKNKNVSEENGDILRRALENSGLVAGGGGWTVDPATGLVRRHLTRNVDGVKWYQCLYCAKEFRKPSDLVRHIRIHTHERPFKCGQCFRAFAVKSTLTAHAQTHSGRKEHACHQCRKLFATAGSLKVHMLLHTGARPYSCPRCPKTFRTSGHRKSHLASHDKTRKKPPATPAHIPPLQEPILITDGYLQQIPKNSVLYSALSQQPQELNPSDRPYKCTFCDKAYKKSSHLKQHIRSHTGEKPFTCFQCSKSFVSNGVLKAHYKTHMGIKAFNCGVCSAAFTTNGSLQRHMIIHSEERPYMCPYCQKTFKNTVSCKKHMNTHRFELAMPPQVETPEKTEPPFKPVVLSLGESFTLESEPFEEEEPRVVQEVFNAETGLVEQVEVICAQTSVEEPQVIEVFEEEPKEPTKKRTKNFKKPFKCEECGQVFRKSSHLKTHLLTHSGKPFCCSVCSHRCTTASCLLDHIKANHKSASESSGKHQCKVCEAAFATRNNLLRHSSTHDTKLPFHCAYCSDRFESREAYKGHLKELHTTHKEVDPADAILSVDALHLKGAVVLQDKGEVRGPHSCVQCGKSFKKPSDLVRHLRTHTGERPFACEQCAKCFTVKSTLDSHLKTHSGLKEHHCQVCEARFSTRGSLKVHMRLHTGSRPFQCPHCDLTFRTSGHCKSHMASHLRQKPYKGRKIRSAPQDVVPPSEPPPPVDLQPPTYQIQVAPNIQMAPNIQFTLDPALLQQLTSHLNFSLAEQPPLTLVTDTAITLVIPEAPPQQPPKVLEEAVVLYECGVCEKRPAQLERHLKTHKTLFQCETCNRDFAKKSQLLKHMKAHH